MHVAGEVPVSFFVGASSGENGAVGRTRLLLVVILWLCGCDVVGAPFLVHVGSHCGHVLGVDVKTCR